MINCKYVLIYQVDLARTEKKIVWSLSEAAICLPHTVEASHCPFCYWTSSKLAVNSNSYHVLVYEAGAYKVNFIAQ